MDKKNIRKKYLNILKELKDTDKKNKIILDKIKKDKNLLKAKNIMCFVSFRNEVDTHNIIKYLLKKEKYLLFHVLTKIKIYMMRKMAKVTK